MEENSKTHNYKDLIITVNDIFASVGKTVNEVLEDLIVCSIKNTTAN